MSAAADPYEDIKSRMNGGSGDQERKPSSLRFLIEGWLSTTAFAGEAPEIPWLVEGAIPRGVPGMVASSGDLGKSMLLLELGLRVACGPRPLDELIFGGRVLGRGAVVILTAEDSKTSVHRRLEGLDRGAIRRQSACSHPLFVIPLPDAGGPIAIVAEGREGVALTEQFIDLKAALTSIPNLALVVLDPLQAFVRADVNADPTVAQLVCAALAELAAETGATVLVAHHVRKGTTPPASADDMRDMIRGTTALVDGLRVAIGLAPSGEREARAVLRHLGRPWEPRAVARCAVVKSNEPVRRDMRTLVRDGTGLLVDVTPRLAGMDGWTKEQMSELVNDILVAAQGGRPFTKTGQSGLYARRTELHKDLQTISRKNIEEMSERLLEERRIVQALAPGSTVVKWLDVPQGPFATGTGEFAPGAKQAKSGPKTAPGEWQ
jgi:hypothetical protein